MTTKKKPPTRLLLLIDGNTENKLHSSLTQYSIQPPPIQAPQNNRFEQAHAHRGTLSDRQLFTLDMYRAMMDSDQYNAFREKIGVEWWTPNYRLSRQQAHRMIELIKEGEADHG